MVYFFIYLSVYIRLFVSSFCCLSYFKCLTATKNINSVGWHWSSHNQNHISASLIWKLTPLWTWKSISLTGTERFLFLFFSLHSYENRALFSQEPSLILVHFFLCTFNSISELCKCAVFVSVKTNKLSSLYDILG